MRDGAEPRFTPEMLEELADDAGAGDAIVGDALRWAASEIGMLRVRSHAAGNCMVYQLIGLRDEVARLEAEMAVLKAWADAARTRLPLEPETGAWS